jgi:hypothetical protein
MQTLAYSPKNATHAPSDRECRQLLRNALVTLNAACPPGFWSWLDWRHPRYFIKLTETFPARINAAWETPRLEPIILDYLHSASVAIAVYCLHGEGESR